MSKIYHIDLAEEYCCDTFPVDYVCYFKNETHLYLICTEKEYSDILYLRIKVEHKNKKMISEYEPYYTTTFGMNNQRIYEPQ